MIRLILKYRIKFLVSGVRSPYLLVNSFDLKQYKITNTIIGIIKIYKSCHHPLIPISCNLLAPMAKIGNKLANEKI